MELLFQGKAKSKLEEVESVSNGSNQYGYGNDQFLRCGKAIQVIHSCTCGLDNRHVLIDWEVFDSDGWVMRK